jgi:hypothetical protein
MKIIKHSEYNFTTVTVGYLAITSVDKSQDVEVRVEGEYDENGSKVNQRIIEEGSGDTIYDAAFLVDLINIPEKKKLLAYLDDIVCDL